MQALHAIHLTLSLHALFPTLEKLGTGSQRRKSAVGAWRRHAPTLTIPLSRGNKMEVHFF